MKNDYKKLIQFFKNKRGRSKGVNKFEIMSLALSKPETEIKKLNPYAKYETWMRIKGMFKVLRNAHGIFIVCEFVNEQYVWFVLNSTSECNTFTDRLNKINKGINNTIKKAKKYVK